jgi:hypothetical protein
MVDALRRAHDVLVPSGWIVDLHPTDAPAMVMVGANATGHVSAGDAPQRHAAATAAIATIVERGLFETAEVVEFAFNTYGDDVDELHEYIADNWRDARFDRGTVSRTREALRAAPPGVRARAVETVRLTTLRRLRASPA